MINCELNNYDMTLSSNNFPTLLYVCVHTCMYMYVHVCCMYMYVHVCTCMYMYVDSCSSAES